MVVSDDYYQKHIPIDTIFEKLDRQFNNMFFMKRFMGENNRPFMLLFITKTMHESFKLYGDALNFDAMDKFTMLRDSNFFGKYWQAYLFTGLDTNKRIMIFGAAMILHNKK